MCDPHAQATHVCNLPFPQRDPYRSLVVGERVAERSEAARERVDERSPVPVPAPARAWRRPSRTTTVCAALIGIGTLLSLVLRWMIPLNPIALDFAVYDGGLFERIAVSLANNDWLGPFDQLTLVKGPAYPAFIAGTHRLGIPLHVGQQITYLMAALALAACVRLVTRNTIAATIVYLIVAFDPGHFSALAAHIIRDEWYSGLSLLFLCAVFIAMFLAVNGARMRWVLPSALLAGGSGAAFWLCREEGVWMGASLVLIVGGLPLARLIGWYRTKDRPRPDRRQVGRFAGRMALTVAVVLGAFYAPISVVARNNQRSYGVAITTDLASGAFPKAYAAWSRVRGVPLTDFVPINRAQRMAVYPLSAAARELQPRLEDPANGWAQWGCARMQICDDFPGGAAIWVFRDAAYFSGNFRNERAFQAFFTRLADEINHACDTHQLTCSRKLPPSMQPLDRTSLGALVTASIDSLRILPTDPTFYSVYGPAGVNTVPDWQRAMIAVGMSGGPSSQAAADAAAQRFLGRAWIYRGIGDVHRLLFQMLLVLAAVGFVLSLLWRKDRARNVALWVLSASLIAGIAVRLVLVAVINTTQFTGDVRFHYATRTFYLALAAIGAVNLVKVVRAHPSSSRFWMWRSAWDSLSSRPSAPGLPPAGSSAGSVGAH